MSSEPKKPRHPSTGWCAATTKSGNRCLNNAVTDGLCTRHWRMAYERERAEKTKAADEARTVHGPGWTVRL